MILQTLNIVISRQVISLLHSFFMEYIWGEIGPQFPSQHPSSLSLEQFEHPIGA